MNESLFTNVNTMKINTQICLWITHGSEG